MRVLYEEKTPHDQRGSQRDLAFKPTQKLLRIKQYNGSSSWQIPNLRSCSFDAFLMLSIGVPSPLRPSGTQGTMGQSVLMYEILRRRKVRIETLPYRANAAGALVSRRATVDHWLRVFKFPSVEQRLLKLACTQPHVCSIQILGTMVFTTVPVIIPLTAVANSV